MFKEKNLVFKLGGEMPRDAVSGNVDGQSLNFSGEAPDPRPKTKNVDSPYYVKGKISREDLNILSDNGNDVLKFGGDKNAVTGQDVYDLLSVSKANGGEIVEITCDNNPAVIAFWDRNRYIYGSGKDVDKPVRFLNGKNYTVSSATERIASNSGKGDVQMGEVKFVQPEESKFVSRFAALDAQRGNVDAAVNAALANYAPKDVETQPTAAMLAMREKMAAKDAENARIRQELEAKYLKEGEEPGKVALGFLKMRHENAELEAKTQQARKEFPAKLPESSIVGAIDGARKLKLDNGRFALYLDTVGKTIVPGSDGRNMAIYDKNDDLEEVKDFYDFNPDTRSKIKKLYS